MRRICNVMYFVKTNSPRVWSMNGSLQSINFTHFTASKKSARGQRPPPSISRHDKSVLCWWRKMQSCWQILLFNVVIMLSSCALDASTIVEREARTALNSFLPACRPQARGELSAAAAPGTTRWRRAQSASKKESIMELILSVAHAGGECVNTLAGLYKKWNSNSAFVWCSDKSGAAISELSR